MSLAQPDLGVLRKAQRGDERAFSLILRAYETPVFNYVLRLVGGDRALAEDLTQEVFLRVYQGLPKFSLRSKFTTWLFQVTKNRVLDELRATERRPRALVAIDDIAPLEVLDAPIERIEEIDALWRAVQNLSTDLKMALLLRDVVGLSYTEIADSLEVTLATVKWRIYKAREEVQIALVREGVSFGARRAGYGRAALARSHAAIPWACCCAFGAARDRPHYRLPRLRRRARAAAPGRQRDTEDDGREHEQRGQRGPEAAVAAPRCCRRGERHRRVVVGIELPCEGGRRGGTVGRVPRERTHDGVLDSLRHAGCELADGNDLAAGLLRGEVGKRLELVGRTPGQQLVEHGAERSRRRRPPSPPRRAPAPARGRPPCRAPSRSG